MLVVASVAANDAGSYAVVVTNAYGWVASSNAVLTVTSFGPCSLANSIGRTNGQFQITFSDAPLARYIGFMGQSYRARGDRQLCFRYLCSGG